MLILALLRPIMETGTFVSVQQASDIRLYGYVGIFMAAGLGALVTRDTSRIVGVSWWMLPALAWCWASLTWSATPAVGLKRLILTSIVLWLGFYCVRQIRYRGAIAILRYVFLACLIANFAVVFLYPSVGVHWFDKVHALHQWRGLMGHKNVAGLLSGLVVILFLFDAKHVHPVIRGGALLASATFLAFTLSRTAITVTGLAALVGFLVLFFYDRLRAVIAERAVMVERIGYALCAAFCVALLWFTIDIQPVINMTQDPAAFSRRAEIWQPMLQFYAEHSVAGAGFGSYWPSVSQSSDFQGSWLKNVAQGHNGYLDILVQLGFVGLVLILFACVAMPVAMIYRLIRSGRVARETMALLSALIVLVLGENLSETSLFDRDTLAQVVLVTTIAMLAALSRKVERRTQVRSGGGATGAEIHPSLVRRTPRTITPARRKIRP
jgi:exopolysaccharide production protein ExoQ